MEIFKKSIVEGLEVSNFGTVKRISDNLAPIFAALLVIMESDNIEKFVNLIGTVLQAKPKQFKACISHL